MIASPINLYATPDKSSLVLEEDLPAGWEDAGFTLFARSGDAISRRNELIYGLEIVGDDLLIGHSADPQYFPTEEDHDDQPLNDPAL